MDYTHKILKEREKLTSFDDLDYTPLAIPSGYTAPETTQMTMARIMLTSGIISQDDYYNMIGVRFDGDFNNDSESFMDFETRNDEYIQSAFAEYEDNSDAYNNERMESTSKASGNVPSGVSVQAGDGLGEHSKPSEAEGSGADPVP